MRVLTEAFERDVRPILIECSAKQRGKPRIRRRCVEIASVSSDWKQEVRESENLVAGFRTVFTLYRTEHNYILQVMGESNVPERFPPRYKVVEFETAQEFIEVLADKDDNRVYWSPLTETLLDRVQDSEYLTAWELENWLKATVEEEE